MSSTSSPTLLVFTLGAARESERRALVPAPLRELEVGMRSACLDSVLDAGRACGCRLEVSSPEAIARLPADARRVPQEGAGFGPRLEAAMRAAFAGFPAGAGPLLVVGTDVPGLAASHLARALSLLDEDADRVVLGPSPDGGFYLLAARRPIDQLATRTRWCRRDTLRGLLRALAAAGRPVTLLAPLADLDRPADLDRWLSRARELQVATADRWQALTVLLRRALAGLRRPFAAPPPLAPRLAFAPRLAGRAPPSR
jgi:2-phospho-L-lactate guanylyltransferase (CobY/MobA/RfbA family)